MRERHGYYMKKKWSGGKIAAVVCGSVAAAALLLITFGLGVARLTRNLMEINSRIEESRYASEGEDSGYDYDYEQDFPFSGESGGGGEDSSEYYEFHNDIKNGLSYSVDFEVRNEAFGENGNIRMEVSYPVVKSLGSDELAGVNAAVQKELGNISSYLESISGQIGAEDEYIFQTESYVTYMDENILSIAYIENGYYDDELYESYVISVNVDMDSQMALTNTQLLRMDDDFSIEFRNRCEEQNGEIDTLSYYSDQNITELLNSEDHLILLYTPLGMEVGINYSYGWVTVTYPDYEKYQSQL